MQAALLLFFNLSILISLACASLEAYNYGHSAPTHKRSLPKDEDVLFILARRADQSRPQRVDAAQNPLDPEMTRQSLELTRSQQNKKAQLIGVKALNSAWKSARATLRVDRTYEQQKKVFRLTDPEPFIKLQKNMKWQELLDRHYKDENRHAKTKVVEEGRSAKDVVRKLKSIGISDPREP